MKETRKAERRHHKARVRRKRVGYVAHWKARNERAVGVAVETPTAVSAYREKGPSLQDLRYGDWKKDVVAGGDVAFLEGNRVGMF